ncbi:MAG: OmpA family protein [Planctomycetaceae bacterium]|nr:OmpA family protein [Planctomycetaceae bacterium]
MRKIKCPPPGAPGWIVTYADLMSLLFTFFVMLFAMSSLDAKKAESVSQIMRETFGTTRNTFYVPFPGQEWQPTTAGGLKTSRSMTVETIQSGNPTKSLPIPLSKPKERITTGMILFENDSDTLGKDAIQVVQEIYQRLKGTPLMIEIRGHAGLHEKTPNRDSMDLAYARAYMVRKHLIDLGIDTSRIIITSWGTNRVAGSVAPSQVGISNAYVEVVLISETPDHSDSRNNTGNPESVD